MQPTAVFMLETARHGFKSTQESRQTTCDHHLPTTLVRYAKPARHPLIPPAHNL